MGIDCLPSDKRDSSGQSDSGISSEGEVGQKIVSTIRLTKLDFCDKVTGKMRQTT